MNISKRALTDYWNAMRAEHETLQRFTLVATQSNDSLPRCIGWEIKRNHFYPKGPHFCKGRTMEDLIRFVDSTIGKTSVTAPKMKPLSRERRLVSKLFVERHKIGAQLSHMFDPGPADEKEKIAFDSRRSALEEHVQFIDSLLDDLLVQGDE